jgi:hypothetical protein
MNQDSSAYSKEEQQPKGLARENDKDNTQEYPHYSNTAQNPPADDVERVERFMNGIVREWRRLDFFKRVELAISVIGIVVLVAYTTYTAMMYGANRDAADAARDAANTADKSLKLTRDVFRSSQSAILQPEISTRGAGIPHFVQINIHNVGHTPATRVNGDISLLRDGHSAKTEFIKDQIVSDRSTSADILTGYMTRIITLEKELDVAHLYAQRPKVITRLQYWNGVEEISQNFSSCFIWKEGGENGGWVDCETVDAYK